MPDAADRPGQGAPIHRRPVDLLSQLIQFDTSNPPGDERACVEWIADRLPRCRATYPEKEGHFSLPLEHMEEMLAPLAGP